jgi:hypothetical protein
MEDLFRANKISRFTHLNRNERQLQGFKSKLDNAYRDFLVRFSAQSRNSADFRDFCRRPHPPSGSKSSKRSSRSSRNNSRSSKHNCISNFKVSPPRRYVSHSDWSLDQHLHTFLPPLDPALGPLPIHHVFLAVPCNALITRTS